jgi:hypothetical protein
MLRHYVLRADELTPVGLTVSLPDPLSEQPLPVLVVLGGANPGRKNLRQVPTAGTYVLVGYDWPLPRKLPKGLDLARALPDVYPRMLEVPGQVAAVIGWIADQAWADPGRISLLGFSLGALVAPAAQRMARSNGHDVGWTVLAYGGADLGEILAAHPKANLGWSKPWVGAAANLLLRPLEPAEHLPELAQDRRCARRRPHRDQGQAPGPARGDRRTDPPLAGRSGRRDFAVTVPEDCQHAPPERRVKGVLLEAAAMKRVGISDLWYVVRDGLRPALHLEFLEIEP